MSPLNANSLIWKALVVLVVVFGLTACAISISSAWRINKNMTAQFEARGIAIAESFAGASTDASLLADARSIQARINQFRKLDGVAYVLVVDAKGEILAHTFGSEVPADVKELDVDKQSATAQRLTVEGIGDVINASSPILQGRAGHVHVGMDRKFIRAASRLALVDQAPLIVFLFLLSLSLVAILMRRLVQPIRILTAYANTLATSGTSAVNQGLADAEVLAIARRSDEVGQLAQAFHYMINEVSAQEHKLRKAHDELEMRVRERTKELELANLALQSEIADRHRAEHLLRESDDRLHLALKSSGVGTWTWDLSDNSIVWDDYLPPLYGLEPGTPSGGYEKAIQRLHPDDRDRVAQEAATTIDKDVPLNTEFQVVWPDASIHALACRGMVSRDAHQRAVMMTGVCWDITERRRLEERFRTAVESAPAAMVMVEKSGRIVLINHQTESLFGYDRRELIGRMVEELIPEHFRPGHLRLRDGFFANPQPLLIGSIRALVGRRSDGTEFPIELGLNPIQTKDGMFVLAAVVDITDRVQAQETLALQAAELARSNKELEQFAYIASHDLQEPLRKVQSFGDLLFARSAESLGEEGRDYLRRMQHAASRMQGLISDLLSYSRIATQVRPFLPVDLARIAQEVIVDLEARIKSTGGTVKIGELPCIDGDALQMRQLFQNLVGNALKFHRPNQPPFVEIECQTMEKNYGTHVKSTASSTMCEITVRDNGIGFEEKYLEKIFTPFQRLHGRGEYEGTGIGLAICRKIVDRHGGSITARSTPGDGAAFIVTLPLHQTKGNPSHA